MEPLVAAVWSCDPEVALDYPARYLFEFLAHHGMLSVTGSPQWRTVVGGSREYVARVAAGLDEVRVGTKVTSVRETADAVEVTDGNGATTAYDAVVIATHPGQALAMLQEPTSAQREVLAAIPYADNLALLHTDTSLLPRAGRARALVELPAHASDSRGAVTVTYDLTRLQRLPTQTRYLVTLGGEDLVDPRTVVARMEYAHPMYNPASVAAQRRLPEANTARLAFAGAYHGWGFHEDGARSGAAAAEHLGLSWDEPVTHEPRLYDVQIRHTRRRPFRRQFAHRSHVWLVDLDALPDHGLLGRFEARDHLGAPDASIRANVDDFLAAHGIDLTGGRVLMAANARAFGNGFNPISVFWCFDRAGAPAGTIVEVHNTYGGRHAYLVHPDDQRPGPGRQVALRLPVPRHRRLVRRRRTGAGRRAPDRDHAPYRGRRDVLRLAVRPAYDGLGAPSGAGGNPRGRSDPNARHLAVAATPAGTAHDPTTVRKRSDDHLPEPSRSRPLARPRRRPDRPAYHGLRRRRASAVPRGRAAASR